MSKVSYRFFVLVFLTLVAGLQLLSALRVKTSLGTSDGRLICLAANTGQLCADFGEKGVLDLRRGVADKWPDSEYLMTSPVMFASRLSISGESAPPRPGELAGLPR